MRRPGDQDAVRPNDGRGLEIDEDLRYQSRMWTAERFGWAVMAGILAAAAAGIFGHGLLSQSTAGHGSSLLIEYERFVRMHSPLTLRFIANGNAMRADGFSLWISNDFLSNIDPGPMTPEPARAELVSGGIRYYFVAKDVPVMILFQYKANRPGRVSGSFRLNDDQPLIVQHLVYP